MRADTVLSALSGVGSVQAPPAKPIGLQHCSTSHHWPGFGAGQCLCHCFLAALVSPLPWGRHYLNSPVFLERLVLLWGGESKVSLLSCTQMRKDAEAVPISSASFKSHFPSSDALLAKHKLCHSSPQELPLCHLTTEMNYLLPSSSSPSSFGLE